MSTPEEKDCINCPSFLPEERTPSAFSKSPGAAMCQRYGHVLGKHGLKPSAQARITTAFARSCSEFGNPAPLNVPVRPEAHVAIGDTAVLMRGDSSPSEQAAVNNCLQCANLIKPDAVRREMGWSFALCAATGRLLWPNRMRPEAKGCNYRTPGDPRDTTTGVVLLPVFDDAFSIGRSPIENYLAGKPLVSVDPREYPTDAPVTPEWNEAGVRAWRRLYNPNPGSGKPHIDLPIYRADFFSEAEQSKIPQMGDEERPESFVDYANLVWKCAVLWCGLDETPILWGQPGVGKTEAFRHLAWLMQMPFERISITTSSEVDDLAGKFVAEEVNGATVTRFVYGRLSKGWTRPCVLLIDEYNTAMPDVEQFIRPCIDNSKQLVLDQNEGERLTRNSSTFLGLTGNPAHDVKNIGVNTLASAAVDRLMHINVELPPPALERKIIRDRCAADDYQIPDEILDKIMLIANGAGGDDTSSVEPNSGRGGLRDLTGSTLPIHWGLRPQLKVARTSAYFDLLDCYCLAMGDNLEPDTRRALLDVVKQYHIPS